MVSFLFKILGKPSTHFVIGFLVFQPKVVLHSQSFKGGTCIHITENSLTLGCYVCQINMVTCYSSSPTIVDVKNGRLFEVCLCKCSFASATVLVKSLSHVLKYHSLYLWFKYTILTAILDGKGLAIE